MYADGSNLSKGKFDGECERNSVTLRPDRLRAAFVLVFRVIPLIIHNQETDMAEEVVN